MTRSGVWVAIYLSWDLAINLVPTSKPLIHILWMIWSKCITMTTSWLFCLYFLVTHFTVRTFYILWQRETIWSIKIYFNYDPSTLLLAWRIVMHQTVIKSCLRINTIDYNKYSRDQKDVKHNVETYQLVFYTKKGYFCIITWIGHQDIWEHHSLHRWNFHRCNLK